MDVQWEALGGPTQRSRGNGLAAIVSAHWRDTALLFSGFQISALRYSSMAAKELMRAMRKNLGLSLCLSLLKTDNCRPTKPAESSEEQR
jgi:hypothetical protein